MKLVLTTAPVREAEELARKLVEERLAACVNVAPEVRSIYIWEGKLEDEREALMFIKTPANKAKELMTRLKELHSYDVPEILCVDIDLTASNPDYIKWIRDSSVF